MSDEQKFEFILHDLQRIHWVNPKKTLGQIFLDAVDGDVAKLAEVSDQDLIDLMYRKIYKFVKENKNGEAG